MKSFCRESRMVGLATLVGFVVRLWNPAQLGLIHFDEGIYASAGLWSILPGGLARLDPTVISYAPAGFPTLVGLAYLILGVGDVSAILVSVFAGALTIPVIAWLARRTFGPGAGSVAAWLAALSGFPIAFSRMALTDASFLLCWLVAIGLGQRFLERPAPVRAILFGLAVGSAQLFKYHGWLAGGIVAVAALSEFLVAASANRNRRVARIWGFGLLAILAAAIVYAPWFQFVESHGGYASLLRHQRGYLGGFSTWLGHLRVQLAQANALSGGLSWSIGAALCVVATLSCLDKPGQNSWTSFLRRTSAQSIACFGLVSFVPNLGWWVGPYFVWRLRGERSEALSVLGTAWLLLSILTPFYHPYARLWLTLEAIGWVLLSGVLVRVWRTRASETAEEQGGVSHQAKRLDFARRPRIDLMFVSVVILATIARAGLGSWGFHQSHVLDPSASLRLACVRLSTDLPEKVSRLLVLARPSATYYLGRTSASLVVCPDIAVLEASGEASDWLVVDSALLKASGTVEGVRDRLFRRWDVQATYPTTLNLPTLLDIDPGAATRDLVASDFQAPLWLLRPRAKDFVDAR
jgi:hypothetical protein